MLTKSNGTPIKKTSKKQKSRKTPPNHYCNPHYKIKKTILLNQGPQSKVEVIEGVYLKQRKSLSKKTEYIITGTLVKTSVGLAIVKGTSKSLIWGSLI